jgi:hypothetical protein
LQVNFVHIINAKLVALRLRLQRGKAGEGNNKCGFNMHAVVF